jgi:hypothetical protein
MTVNAIYAGISFTPPPEFLRLGTMTDLEGLDELNDVAGVKRAREETEAEGTPDPKFAKFDSGACMCVRMEKTACANIWRA